MTKTIKGRVIDGKIELVEPHDVPEGAEVSVSFESTQREGPTEDQPMRLYYGMFRPPDGRYTTEEDWQEAKKMWEPRDL